MTVPFRSSPSKTEPAPTDSTALGARPPTRRLGHLRGADPGPTLFCVGSLHGNEPAGFEALTRVVEELRAWEERGAALPFGDFHAMTGNLEALRSARRFVARDLNRGWTHDRLERLRDEGPKDVEDREMLALQEALEEARGAARGGLYLLDLHTTSGDSPPFASILGEPERHGFALRFPVPVVLGIEENLDGTLIEWAEQNGYRGAVFEGGRHLDPSSTDHDEAAVWIALATVGLLGSLDDWPDAQRRVEWAEAALRQAAGDLPHLFTISHRHPLPPDSSFHMVPGLRSFQRVARGDLLAYQDGGEVRALRSGRILMPLYQAQGDDGFFLVRELDGAS
ncbi:MAG TPA: succinylglutamate desuccinylase/aspartoacylase family protein [Thermoanaerobaculia bacterium]|nr:succinylglutamate desuccinylase/aspartoacylase family protein [Thermoanaerobaculia bacterium]